MSKKGKTKWNWLVVMMIVLVFAAFGTTSAFAADIAETELFSIKGETPAAPDKLFPAIVSPGLRSAGEVPSHEKKLIDNGDGTFTLELNVTGDAEKAVTKVNVVVVLDVSGSMDYDTGETEVTYTATDTNGSNLYGLVNGEYVPLQMQQSGPWWAPTYTYRYNGVTYTGQRYTRQEADVSRLKAAQDAINALGYSLLSNNGGENPGDTVEMALVTFADNAATPQQPTTSYSQFETIVNSRTAYGGTNWQAGLRAAGNVDFNDDDTTYIIFVSDGNPTFYIGGGTGRETTANINACYPPALTEATSLVNRGFVLYTIGVYGNVDRMEGLAEDSGAGLDRYYPADNTAALQEALNTIWEEILMAGIGSVTINDGTTESVTTETGIAHLLEVDTDSFKYYRSGGEYGTGNGGLGSEWKRGDDPAPPAAELKNGSVIWDLNAIGILENEVTYHVTFEVYPSQYTLDLIADLKNGIVAYEDLDPNIQTYLLRQGSGENAEYSLATNTEASLAYTDTRTGETNEVGFLNPEPTQTGAVKLLSLSKEWENRLDDLEDQDITMKTLRDGDDYFEIGLNKNNDWQNKVYASIGIMTVSQTGKVEIKAAGHDYAFAEPKIIADYWELDAPTMHPMKINGSDTILIELEGDDIPATMTTMTAPAVYSSDGKDYYKLNFGGGDQYYIADNSAAAASLTAVNHRKSTLNITKEVEGDSAPTGAKFSFSMKVTDANSDDIRFSVTDGDTFITNEADISGADAELDEEGQPTGYFTAESGAAVTFKLRAGWKLCMIDVSTNTTYEVSETAMPDNFSLKEVKGKREYDFEYDDEGNQTSSKTEGTGTVEGAKISGTIEATNSHYLVSFTNLYTSCSVSIEATKVLTGLTLKGDDFRFTIASEDGNAPMPEVTEVTNDSEGLISFGPIAFEEAGEYTYILSEIPGNEEGMTYDETPKTVTVSVTADEETGKLTAEIAPEKISFENTYTPPLNKDDHRDYIIGEPDGLSHPEGLITRAEVCTIFFRLLDDDYRNEMWMSENPYSDVKKGQWFNNAVSTMTNCGVIKGCPDGTFRPINPITRAEFATIAVRFFKDWTESVENTFSDIDGHWAYDYILKAVYYGLVTGYPDGTFRPNENITRAEAMAIVNRVLGRHPDKDHFCEGMHEWPDNMDTSKWYYADIQEATNNHEYVEGSDPEQWTKVLPPFDWSELERRDRE